MNRDDFRRLELSRIHGTNALGCLKRHQDFIEEAKKTNPGEDAWKTDDGVARAMASARFSSDARNELYAAVISFQASMEVMLSNLKNLDAGLLNAVDSGSSGFKNEWLSALSHLNIQPDDFLYYHNEVYLGMRNPLIHADNAGDLDKVENIKFDAVLRGIRSGWYAISEACQKLGLDSLSKQESWAAICRIAQVKLRV